MCNAPRFAAPQAPAPAPPAIPQPTLTAPTLRAQNRVGRGINTLTIRGRQTRTAKVQALAARRASRTGSKATALPTAPKLTAQPGLTVLPESRNPKFGQEFSVQNQALTRGQPPGPFAGVTQQQLNVAVQRGQNIGSLLAPPKLTPMQQQINRVQASLGRPPLFP